MLSGHGRWIRGEGTRDMLLVLSILVRKTRDGDGRIVQGGSR
jgi:hypothetical protein